MYQFALLVDEIHKGPFGAHKPLHATIVGKEERGGGSGETKMSERELECNFVSRAEKKKQKPLEIMFVPTHTHTHPNSLGPNPMARTNPSP